MALLTPLTQFLGIDSAKKAGEIAMTRREKKKAVQKSIVDALRNYQHASKPSRLKWLQDRKNALGSPALTPPSQPNTPAPQSFHGKMPIRATQNAIDLIKSLRTSMNCDRIQFPKKMRDGGKIIGVNSADRSRDTSIGTVRVEYEQQINPSTISRIGISLDKKGNMLECVIVYPAVPTDLNSRTQPSTST